MKTILLASLILLLISLSFFAGIAYTLQKTDKIINKNEKKINEYENRI